MQYFKKEIDLGNGDKKVIVYKADENKTIMYRDGQEMDMTEKIPLVRLRWEIDYDPIDEKEAKNLIATQK